MRFYPEENCIKVKTYSPCYHEYIKNSPIEPKHDAHHFVLPYEMTTDKKKKSQEDSPRREPIPNT